ncbi:MULTISPECIES: dTDP-4-dehydrorhamnose reductase [Butyricimonas]|uniref:dTDP-4-dehydrorhamnose reductase n=1 Tax=Butyricimonas TaxID=574697 RepID=UPI001D0922EA|nr:MULTISPECIES: dTDP-4-dehydrorhamnose reductase [Butyricimonas]MCB6972394.1 dTDP-4-dehydrorhamnose reductase [Butyricimonas synergistica]MCG4519402.1 dTDP-4-dehydrorhamnose reductase [Butyricimonas sp. DFI.6.44]
MANILVTGANGQLGTELRNRGFSLLDDVFYTDVEELDITSAKAVSSFIETHEIDTIINCAAYTAVDQAEDDEERAAKINRDAVANLANAALQHDCILLHISTDYVFDGTADQPYTEKSATNPQTVYGRTKLEGEEAIKKSGCMYIIIRTAWLYSAYGHNFVKTIARLANERDEINVVNDQWGTPTYAGDLAEAIIKIMENEDLPEWEGIYHFTNEGGCTWYDFAKEIVALAGADCKVNPVTTAEYPVKAKRPAYSVLDKKKIKDTFELEIRDWRDALKTCMATF